MKLADTHGLYGRTLLALMLAVMAAWPASMARADQAALPSASQEATKPSQPFTLDSPEFPISAYSVRDTDEDFSHAYRIGIRYVHWYGLGQSEDLTRAQKYLDMAHKHGLKVMFDLFGRVWIPKGQEGVESMRRIVRQVKDHPAMGFWYLDDEPDGHRTPEQILPFYQMLKEETPHIPVTMAIHWSKHWDKYTQCYDIMLNDHYPVYAREFPNENIQQMTEFSRHSMRLGKPIMPVLQSFNWGPFIKEEWKKTEHNGVPVDQMRPPNLQELRYWHFSSIVMGARGISYWAYHFGKRYSPEWVQGPYAEAVTELSDFTRMLSPVTQFSQAKRAMDDNLYIGHWKREGQRYLVLVNAWPVERDIRRNLTELTLGAPAFDLKPWGLTASTPAHYKGHHLVVKAQPWEVFIWEITPAK